MPLTVTLLALSLVMAPPVEKPTPKPILIPIPDYTVSVGDEVCLYCADARGELLRVAFADDFDAFDGIQTAIAANDTQGILKLIDEDKTVHLLPSGTRVRVLRKPTLAPPEFPLEEKPTRRDVQVRILDGPMAGKTGYAIYEYVRACRVVQPKAKAKSRRR